MLDVNIEKILPVTEVRDSLNKIVDEVESTDELYVVTKNGKPSAILVGVHHLEKLTGIDHKELLPDADSDAAGTDGGIDNTIEGQGATAPVTTSNSMPAPESPIIPLSGDLDNGSSDASTPISTIPTLDETSAPSATGAPPGPATGANNGAQASPLASPSQPASITAPEGTSSSTSIPSLSAGTTTTSPTQGDDESVEDIFGPIDEPETPAATPVNSVVTPATSLNPIATTPPASTPSTIAGPLPAASPASSSTPPTQNPPTTAP